MTIPYSIFQQVHVNYRSLVHIHSRRYVHYVKFAVKIIRYAVAQEVSQMLNSTEKQ